MRILFVTGSYPPDRCGVGDYTQRLATALAEFPGTLVSVLTSGPGAECAEAGVTVWRLMPNWSLRSVVRLIRAMRRIRPDIVHVQYPTQGYGAGGLPWLVPLLVQTLRIRAVQTWHEGFQHDLIKFFFMAIAPGRVIVVREAFVRQFGRAFGLAAGLRRLIYINGASTLPKANLSTGELAKLRARYGISKRRLLVFFGFIHPGKQIEQLFEIGDPDRDHILVVGNADNQAEYLTAITALTLDTAWAGRARVVGFTKAEEAATMIAAADALVLPLRAGGGEWNSSVLAGILQGTFVLTTSISPTGYNADTNVYYARIDDLADMRHALQTYAGIKRAAVGHDAFDWRSIAGRHIALYRSLLRSRLRVAR